MPKHCKSCYGEHCCHDETKVVSVTDPRTGEQFERTTCVDCGKWISDRYPVS